MYHVTVHKIQHTQDTPVPSSRKRKRTGEYIIQRKLGMFLYWPCRSPPVCVFSWKYVHVSLYNDFNLAQYDIRISSGLYIDTLAYWCIVTPLNEKKIEENVSECVTLRSAVDLSAPGVDSVLYWRECTSYLPTVSPLLSEWSKCPRAGYICWRCRDYGRG